MSGWSERARDAAIALSTGEERGDDSVTVMLLRDIYAYFSANGEAGRVVQTSALLAHLHGLEESPWGEWYGKPLSAHGLSRLLKPYRIKTMTVYAGHGESVRGYKAEQFADAFSRGLALEALEATEPASLSQNRLTLSNASNASDENPAEQQSVRATESVRRNPASEAASNASNASNAYPRGDESGDELDDAELERLEGLFSEMTEGDS